MVILLDESFHIHVHQVYHYICTYSVPRTAWICVCMCGGTDAKASLTRLRLTAQLNSRSLSMIEMFTKTAVLQLT